MERPDPVHIGDGAYVEINEIGTIVVFTHDGTGRENEVFFEPPEALRLCKVIGELLAWRRDADQN